MKYRNSGYFVKKTRFYSGTNVINSIVFFIKSVIFSGIIFLIFIFAVNLIIKYIVNRMDIKLPEISFVNFNVPRFIIIENRNFYALYSNGDIKLVESNIDNLNLPIISGFSTKEDNQIKNKLIKDILKIKKRFLIDISEINIKNPENIIIFTMNGKKIFSGKEINNEKMENYSLVKSRLQDMKIRYKSVSLLDDRVIVKKEGK